MRAPFLLSLTAAAAIATATQARAQTANETTYDWMFTVESVSDGFSGPPTYLGQVLGSGTLTTSNTPTASTFVDLNSNATPAQSYNVTSVTGTLAGAQITGLGVSDNWSGDNTLQIVPGQGWVLAPSGTVVVNTNQPVDGASQLYLNADNFIFGGFVDTANGNEWQGEMTLTPVPAAQTAAAQPVPEPAPLTPFGGTVAGFLTLICVGAWRLDQRQW